MVARATDNLRIVPLPLFLLPSISITGEASFQSFFNISWFSEVNKQLINAMSIKDLEGRKVMSEEKEKVEKLTERIDELLIILNSVAEDLRQVSGSLKSLAVSQITQPPAGPAAPAPETPEVYGKETSIEDIRMMFPEDLEDLLSFEEKQDHIVIKPRQFLGSDNFAKIASIVRGIGGDYVSAGKESHFRVPKK